MFPSRICMLRNRRKGIAYIYAFPYTKDLNHITLEMKSTVARQTTVSCWILTYGAEPFLRSCQLCSHSRIPSILWIPKVHYPVHKSPPLVPILSQIDPVHTILSLLTSILLVAEYRTRMKSVLPAKFVSTKMTFRVWASEASIVGFLAISPMQFYFGR
jgi:hypothetical protein